MKRFAIVPLLLLGLLGLLSGGFRGLGNTTPCSFVVPNAGSVPANTLAGCLTNPADTVLSLSNWSTAANYIWATNRNQFAFKSTATYRDVEVSHWTRQGYTYLRLDGTGTAIYFNHDGETANGYLEIGIVTGLDETASPGGTYYALYVNDNLVSSIGTSGTVCTCGYTKTATQGQYWTFGVSGFDIYVKYDGVEFARFKDWHQMNYGAVAVKSNSTGQYGFRNADGNAGHITIKPTLPPALYSRYSLGEIDMRDWGLRNVAATTGNISSVSNPNLLTVANASNFKVGDWIIVEIGTEAGAGLRGTVGVGGTWPSTSYASKAALDASGTPATGFPTYAWTRDTGTVYVYQSSPAGWTNVQTQTQSPSGTYNNLNSPSPQYYPTLAVPRSLHAKISAKSGNALTLVQLDGTTAANASATATGANVYLDNQQPFNDLLQPPRQTRYAAIDKAGMTLVIPSGTYYIGGLMKGGSHTNWTIKGSGKASTIIKSGKGMRGAGISLASVDGVTISDMTVNGNFGNNYFGLDFFDTLTPVGASTQVTEYAKDGSIIWKQEVGGVSDTEILVSPQGAGIVVSSSVNALVQDVNINEIVYSAIGFQTVTNGQATRVATTLTDPTQIYEQWMFEWAGGSTGGGCTDCSINCGIWICSGPEMFGASGVVWTRMVTTNAAWSINASGSFTVQDGSVTFTTNSKSPFWTSTESMVAVDTNTGAGFAQAGGAINNLTLVGAYVDGINTVSTGINIGASNFGDIQNVTITGGSYIGPNYDALSGQINGPQGIFSNANALNINVSGFTSKGTIHPAPYSALNANIGVTHGAVINSCGDSAISAPTTSGNTVPCP